MTHLRDRTRRRGAKVTRKAPGRYTVYGHRQTGAVLALEAVATDVTRWVDEVADHE